MPTLAPTSATGAHATKPDDSDPGPCDPAAPLPQVFRTVHCAQIANDGLVYVCDRANDRIQVFRKDGTFVKEAQIAKNTLGDGVVFDIGFSRDKEQRHAFVADGANHRVWTILREPLQVVSHFGNGGRMPGQFYAVHNVSLDSKGNIYTVERGRCRSSCTKASGRFRRRRIESTVYSQQSIVDSQSQVASRSRKAKGAGVEFRRLSRLVGLSDVVPSSSSARWTLDGYARAQTSADRPGGRRRASRCTESRRLEPPDGAVLMMSRFSSPRASSFAAGNRSATRSVDW